MDFKPSPEATQPEVQGPPGLAAGTYVVSTSPAGPVTRSIWRPHLYVVATLLVVTGAALLAVSFVPWRGMLQDLLVVKQQMQASGLVRSVGVSAGTAVHFAPGARAETRYLQVTANQAGAQADPEALARELAAIALASYPGAAELDVIAVRVTRGYDIYIARGWQSNDYRRSPAQWQAVLGR